MCSCRLYRLPRDTSKKYPQLTGRITSGAATDFGTCGRETTSLEEFSIVWLDPEALLFRKIEVAGRDAAYSQLRARTGVAFM
ncbi:hypothetical protein SAMN04515672_1104 [Natronorubrum texcoconense]|uniref:Uncharacterized protein n=1 Tax=Natronorubrum texcoconense TaxID=1095776 RepID=A0A1G8V067_9EURY|nr:hypothetical protein SAMN04515672_1104 [Natronorubrum texcoconense]